MHTEKIALLIIFRFDVMKLISDDRKKSILIFVEIKITLFKKDVRRLSVCTV